MMGARFVTVRCYLLFKANRKKKKKMKKKKKIKKKKRKKSLIARTMAVSFKPSRDKRLCTTRRVDLNRGDPIVPFGDRIDLGLSRVFQL